MIFILERKFKNKNNISTKLFYIIFRKKLENKYIFSY